MLTTLKHALTGLLLEAAGSAGLVNTATHAVYRVAITAKIVALDCSAAGVDAVVITTASGTMHRNATTSHSLLS